MSRVGPLELFKRNYIYASKFNLGIQTELEDVESRAEEYPLTRAFLKLLDALTNVPIPPNLGAGHRTPGFDPYLLYVKDSVFLKFNGRAYRNETERWQV